MKKSLTINATRDGKKVSKSLGFVNPDVANSIVGGFAQMVNALSNDTFVNAEVVKKMDTTEEETGGATPEPATTKLEPTLTISEGHYQYNGDGEIFGYVEGYYESLSIDRVNKTWVASYNTVPIANNAYTVYLHATEGELYAPKTVSYYYSDNAKP